MIKIHAFLDRIRFLGGELHFFRWELESIVDQWIIKKFSIDILKSIYYDHLLTRCMHNRQPQTDEVQNEKSNGQATNDYSTRSS